MKPVVIVAAKRTAIGKFGGSLAKIAAPDLGAVVLRALLEQTGVAGEAIDEVILGQVLTAGAGQNPARQTLIKAGLPNSVSAMTINKVCGSGLKAVMLGAQAIACGDADIVIAGGQENMSASAHILPNSREGFRMGNASLVDTMIKDGLWDAFNDYHMGITSENVAEKYGVTREEQDQAAYESQTKACAAIKNGSFKAEIVPVIIKTKKGEVVFDTDEFPREGTTMEALAKLKPAFKKDGTVTAGNASGINDGGAALVVMSADKAKELGLTAMARILSYASTGVDPKYMGLGPISASRKALDKAKLTMQDIDLIEANEAFAAQFVEVGRELNFDKTKVNVNGGAIALGHPIGASGARILVTLLYALKAHNKKLGLATLCIGGGQGTTTIVELI